jgi:hypothetical protein
VLLTTSLLLADPTLLNLAILVVIIIALLKK